MFDRMRTHGIVALLTAVAALTFLAGSAQAENSGPTGMTKAEYRALIPRPGTLSPAEQRADMRRAEALDRRYGLGGTQVAAGMTKAVYRSLIPRPGALTQAEQHSVMLRAEALDRRYGLAGMHVVAASPRPAVTIPERGFAWGDFGIGAAAMLGLVLLASGLVVTTRHFPRARVSS